MRFPFKHMLDDFAGAGIRSYRGGALTKTIFTEKHLRIVTVAEKS